MSIVAQITDISTDQKLFEYTIEDSPQNQIDKLKQIKQLLDEAFTKEINLREQGETIQKKIKLQNDDDEDNDDIVEDIEQQEIE